MIDGSFTGFPSEYFTPTRVIHEADVLPPAGVIICLVLVGKASLPYLGKPLCDGLVVRH